MRCSSLLRLLEDGRSDARGALVRVHGTRTAGLVEERRQAWSRVARRFLDYWGDRDVFAFRAPARISLNPHCEHQGAWVPYGAHRRELICLVGPRPDDVITLTNVDTTHRSGLSFRVREEIAVAASAWRRGWTDYIEDAAVVRRREALADPKARQWDRTGSVNFIKAAALRLAREAHGQLRGVDLVVEGDIPIGVGQSSSSALVVVAALALNRLWNVGIEPRQLASICGEAEWYVGTRGGAGDHAAMLLGSPDGLVGMRFVPPVAVRDTRAMCLPADYQILIANSGQKAIKNKEERRLFNAGIFAYRFALVYLKETLEASGQELCRSALDDGVRFLADFHVGKFALHTIYRLLLSVPETVSPQDLAARCPESYQQAALACFGTEVCDELPSSIPIRGAALYGLGRVDRGLAMHELCARGDEAAMVEFGRLMSITHDGDRVSQYDAKAGRFLPYLENRRSVSDDRLARLVEMSSNGRVSLGSESAELRHQPGYYGASTENLDRIVDLASSLPDVLGAGLMGAGGGGCVLVLARAGEGTISRVTETLAQGYYAPLGKPADVEPWVPSQPAGEVSFSPGPGVRGHRIPVDAHYRAGKAREHEVPLRLIGTPAQINAAMPHHIAARVVEEVNNRGLSIRGARVLLLGMGYERGASDTRDSPALRMLELLAAKGAKVTYHDPYVPEVSHNGTVLESVPLTEEVLRAQACVVLVTDHDYDFDLVLRASPLLIDTRNAVKRDHPNCVRLWPRKGHSPGGSSLAAASLGAQHHPGAAQSALFDDREFRATQVGGERVGSQGRGGVRPAEGLAETTGETGTGTSVPSVLARARQWDWPSAREGAD